MKKLTLTLIAVFAFSTFAFAEEKAAETTAPADTHATEGKPATTKKNKKPAPKKTDEHGADHAAPATPSH